MIWAVAGGLLWFVAAALLALVIAGGIGLADGKQRARKRDQEPEAARLGEVGRG